MCATCGCGNKTVVHHHDGDERIVTLEKKVLAKNDELAEINRDWLSRNDIHAVSLMGSPGAGKTTLLVRTVAELAKTRRVSVVEGDQATMLDAERIEAAGCDVLQVNTGTGCHLDAEMFRRALDSLNPEPGSLLFIENVGNLVCPALFDLGEHHRIVLISVTEGDDKPLKYPHMFGAADTVVVNKLDLLPYVDFDLERCVAQARSLSSGVEVIPISATTGEGLDSWFGWLAQNRHPVH